MTDSNSRQVGGSHYASAFQHWDLVWQLKLGYFPGQITKYALRWRKKNGAQDLEKAVHFATKYAELLAESEQGSISTPSTVSFVENKLAAFVNANDVDGRTLQVFRLLSHSHDVESLKLVRTILETQLETLRSEGAATPAYVNQ